MTQIAPTPTIADNDPGLLALQRNITSSAARHPEISSPITNGGLTPDEQQTQDELAQLDAMQKQIQPRIDQANGNSKLINAYVTGQIPNNTHQMGAGPSMSDGSPATGGEPMIQLTNSQTGEVRMVPQSQLGQYNIASGAHANGGAQQPSNGPSFSNGQPATAQQTAKNDQPGVNIPGQVDPYLAGEKAAQEAALQQFNAASGNASIQQNIANTWRAKYGYDLNSPKPLSAQQQTTQGLNQDFAKTKGNIQGALDAFQNLPDGQKGVHSISSVLGSVPWIGQGLESFVGHDAQNYQKQISGLGEYANLLPSPTNDPKQNQANVLLLDNALKAKYGTGLDDTYLKQYGLSKDGNGNVTATPPQPGMLSRLATGAKNDVMGIGNNIAQGAFDDIRGANGHVLPEIIGNNIINGVKSGVTGEVSELGKLLPVSIDNGKATFDPGKTGNELLDHPVNAASAVLPFLGGVKALVKGEAPIEGSIPNSPNPVQNALRGVTDATTGGGTKNYISQVAKNGDKLPFNQVLNDEGYYLHPTQTGKIQANAQALQKYGSQLSSVYDNAGKVNTTSSLKDTLVKQLSPKYGANTEPLVSSLLKDTAKNGSLDLTTGNVGVTAAQQWKTAQNLENFKPPPIKNVPAGSDYRTSVAKDAARVMRQDLSSKVPQAQDIANRYQVFKENESMLSDPHGAELHRPLQTINTSIKSLVDAGLNGAYKVAGKFGGSSAPTFSDGSSPVANTSAQMNPTLDNAPFQSTTPQYGNTATPPQTGFVGSNLKRDMRFKNGNAVFKSK